MRPDKTNLAYNLNFFETPLEEFIDKRHELVKTIRINRLGIYRRNLCQVLQRSGKKRKELGSIDRTADIIIYEESI